MSVEFGSTDIASMLSEMDNEEKSGKSSLFWNPKTEGVTAIRFLPQLKSFNEKIFYQKRRTHWINGHSVLCPNQSLKDKNGNVHEPEVCPICAKSRQLYNSSERGSAEWDLAGQLRAKDRYVSRIIVRGKKEKNANGVEVSAEYKPEFFEFGKKIHEMIRSTLAMGECGDVFSLKEGRDFNLSKKGTGRNTDYSGSTFSMKQSPVFSDAESLKALLAELPNMDYAKLNEFTPVEQLNEELKEMFSEKKDDFDNSDTWEDKVYASKPVEPAAEPAKTETESIDDLLNQI